MEPFAPSSRHGRLSRLLFSLPIVLAWAAPAFADGFIYIPDPPDEIVRVHRIRPVPRPRPHFPLEVTRHRVSVEIEGRLVKTRVEERFHNPNRVQLEGVYMFPLPGEAAVSSFSMEAGGKELSGEILEKDRARQIYEQIVRRIKDPGLLEYVDRGLFRASVFPIPANGHVDVTIEYSESLSRTAGFTRYRYPLDTGKYAWGSYKDVVIDVELEDDQPIRSIHCPSHDVSISRPADNRARIAFEAKTLAADKDFILQWNVSKDSLAPVVVTHRGHERDGFFFLSITPRPERVSEPPPKDVVFVIDTSGSMSGRKLDQVKRALRYSIEGLNDEDRFNIIDFSTEARRFRQGVVEVSESSREQALFYVDELAARGGTNIEEGVRFALEGSGSDDRVRIVVLLTDGEPTIGVTRVDELVRSVRDRNEEHHRIFAFGVGEDLNAKLLDLLVKENRGAAQYIRGDENLEVPLSNFFDKIDSPVLTDLRLEIRGGEVSSVYPKPLPDLFRGEQLDVFGRYREDGRKVVVLRGKFLGRERVFEYSLRFEGARSEHLPRLWALRKIGHLLEEMRLHGENKELEDEVIRLSKLHGVLTPYTSYLIVEEDELARAQNGTRRRGLERLRSAARDAVRLGAPAPGAEAEGVSGESASRFHRERVREAFKADTGAGAVEQSEQLAELKAGRVADRRGAFGPGGAGPSGPLPFRQVGEKTFYLQDGRWIDAVLTTRELDEDEDLRRVKYLSDEYFELLEKYPEIGRFLGVGPRVTFLWKGELMSVVD